MKVTVLEAVEKEGNSLFEVVYFLGCLHFMVSFLLLLVLSLEGGRFSWRLLVDGFSGLRSGR